MLRPGGTFVCVDSLNDNPVYRVNRWLNFRRGERTASTLRRIPDTKRIDALGRFFTSVTVRWFGSISWMMPLLARVLGSTRAGRVSNAFDELIGVRRSAFKFVLAARGRR